MVTDKAYYTMMFRHLHYKDKHACNQSPAFKEWKIKWIARSRKEVTSMDPIAPLYILRNYIVPKVTETAAAGQCKSLREYLKVLQNPYTVTDTGFDYYAPSTKEQRITLTICGT